MLLLLLLLVVIAIGAVVDEYSCGMKLGVLLTLSGVGNRFASVVTAFGPYTILLAGGAGGV